MPKALEYKITTVVISLLIGWLGLLSWGAYRANQQAEKTLVEINSKISAVRRDNQKLEKEREWYKTSAYLDKQARIRLNYKSAGEQVVFVYPAEQQATINFEKLSESDGIKGIWKYLFGLFTKIF